MSDGTSKSTDPAHLVEVHGLGMTYPGEVAHTVLADLNFVLRENEGASIVGPSGVGKTTLLRCIAGLQAPSSGHVTFRGSRVKGPFPGLAMVFQDYSRSLMPWMSNLKNVMLPLRAMGVGKQERRSRALAALEEVGLAGVGGKRPYELSGGMQQRVAIARAIATKPDLLMMDEPFASLDAQTRYELEDLTLALRKEHGMSVVVVTHDIDESVYMSDRVLVLDGHNKGLGKDIPIDLGTDRNQAATRATEIFTNRRAEIAALLERGSAG